MECAHTLAKNLKTALGKDYDSFEPHWDGDAVCAFFEWLAMTLWRHYKEAEGNQTVFEELMHTPIQQAIALLMGKETLFP